MFVDERKIWIYWRKLESSYAYANKEGLDDIPRSVGSSVSAVNKMLGNSEEQKVLMENIIGLSPTNEHWAAKLANYWHSISEEVPSTGKQLEVGFIYDLDSMNKSDAIDKLNKHLKEGNKIVESKGLSDYFDDRLTSAKLEFNKAVALASKLAPVEMERKTKLAYDIYYDMIWAIESERYKFGQPIDTAHYMLYRYCLVYSHVANSIDLATKSPNIRFYLHSEADIKREKETRHKLEKDRINTYIKVITSPTKVENILYAMGKGDIIKSMDETDQFILLEQLSKDKSRKFVSTATDKNLTTRGLIEKYIAYSLIRRLDGSQVIVDSVDPSITIGNNISESVNFFTNTKSKAVVDEYAARFKGLPK